MNTRECREKVEALLEKGEAVRIDDVYDDLGIFDWWKCYLTVSDMKSMLSFLRFAEKLGYTEEPCFKVGIAGCANGMWASNGTESLYKSFVPGYIVYDLVMENGKTLLSEKVGHELYTQKEFLKAYEEVR